MAYASRDDLVARFGDEEVRILEDLRFTSAGAPPAVSPVDDALSDATEEANSYIAHVYGLPLPSVPKSLILAVCDMARYLLYKDKATEEVAARYERRISWLKDISAGRAALVFDPPLSKTEQAETKSRVAIGTTYTGGVFSNETLNKMPGL